MIRPDGLFRRQEKAMSLRAITFTTSAAILGMLTSCVVNEAHCELQGGDAYCYAFDKARPFCESKSCDEHRESRGCVPIDPGESCQASWADGNWIDGVVYVDPDEPCWPPGKGLQVAPYCSEALARQVARADSSVTFVVEPGLGREARRRAGVPEPENREEPPADEPMPWVETLGVTLVLAVASALMLWSHRSDAVQLHAKYVEFKRRDAKYRQLPLPENEERSIRELAKRSNVHLNYVVLLYPRSLIVEPSVASPATKCSASFFLASQKLSAERPPFVVATSDAMMKHFLSYPRPWQGDQINTILGETKGVKIRAVAANASVFRALSDRKGLWDALRAITQLSEEFGMTGVQIWVDLGQERMLEQERVSLLEQLIPQIAIVQNELDEIDATHPLT